MSRRILRIACSLWFVAASLVPGPGWALCVSASGHVAVEASDLAAPIEHPGESACERECPPEKCESCHDVQLTQLERACSRREIAAPGLDVALAAVQFSCDVYFERHTAYAPALARRPVETPHLVNVLRL